MFLSTSSFFPAHTKSRMYFSSSLRIWIGIEKIPGRYHSLDKIKMLITCTLPIKDSFLGFQNAPLFFILASCSMKIISEVSLFPIHSPKAKTLSSVHLQSKGLSCLFFHLPMKSPSVLRKFTFAPVASSYSFSCLNTSAIDSSLVTKI